MEQENQKPSGSDNGKETSGEKIREIHHHHYRRPGAFFGRLVWGLIIIFIGAVFLAQNAGVLAPVQMGNFFATFWPVFIILVGLSVLARGGWVLGIIATVVMLAILALLFAWFVGAPVLGGLQQTNMMEVREHQISIERNPLANAARVQARFGAGEVNIAGGSEALVSGILRSSFLEPRASSTLEGTIQNAVIEPTGSWRGWGRYINELDLKLNNTLPLGLTVDAGASEINVDLREVVLSSLTLRAGASSINISLGDKAAQSDIAINSGASSITVSLPQNAGVRINMRGGLSSRNFPQFTEVSQGVWESANYASAAKKINMNIEAGVSSVSVNWR